MYKSYVMRLIHICLMQLMHVREGVMGSRTSPGFNGSSVGAQNGAVQNGAVQANGASQALVTTTVTTKVNPPPKPQVCLRSLQ